MRISFYLLFFVFGISSAQLPNISFNGTNAWSTSTGIAFDVPNNSLQITGIGTSNRRSTLVSTIATPPAEFYFYADVWLENTTFHPESIKNPQIVVRDATDAVIYRQNIDEALQNTWFKAGIRINNYTNSTIKFEFSVNNTTGTMKVKNPVLAVAPPSFTYEFPWVVPANITTTLNVNTSQKHSFQNDLLSTNSHFVYAGYQWGDTTLNTAMNSYFPMTNMRFPGGTVGNYYNYNSDTFYTNTHTPNNLQTISGNGYTFRFTNYKNYLTTRNASSTYMMNIITNSTTDSKAEYQNRLSSGLNIKWLEMGNEMYLSGNQVGNVIDVNSYITHTKDLVTKIKSVNANAKLAACVDKDDFTNGSWNYTLSQDQSYFDAATLHNYNSTGVYFYSKYASYAMLKFYKTSMDRFLNFQGLFPNKPLLLTEWGILTETDLPFFIQAMGVADAFLAIEKANQLGIVQQAGLHMLYKNDVNHEATLMYYDTNNALRLTSRGKMFSKLFEVFKDSEVLDADTQSAELETGLKAVNAKMVKNGSNYKIFVVNKLPVASPLILNVNGTSYTGNYTLETYTADMSNPTDGILASSNSWNPVSGSGSITLPASSINVITIASNLLGVTNTSKEEISVFPNPVKDRLYLKIPNNYSNGKAEIYDVSGRKIMGESIPSNKELNVEKLTKGNYIVRLIFDNNSTYNHPFIKN